MVKKLKKSRKREERQESKEGKKVKKKKIEMEKKTRTKVFNLGWEVSRSHLLSG
jgi:hypothetical protein